MRRLLFILLAILCMSQAEAQNLSVSGKVQDAHGKTTLPGATVLLTRTTYNSQTGIVTNGEGNFLFDNVAPGAYTIEVSYLGFKPYSKSIVVQDEALHLGTILLEEASATIKEVQVIGRVPLGEQKGDTTQYNAGAFKTAPDASAEDLVQKMPGITMQNGTIQAQGQEVKQVLVDGKRFFSDDPSTALRNLPADVIANIQIFDKKSDQAELTGVDDGSSEKTINIVTKSDRRQGQFGKASAGYGTDERYMMGASINYFKGDSRFTLTGLTNNVNLLDYSVGETPGGGMRGRRQQGGGGGTGFGNSGSTTGLIATNNLGLNYSDTWGKKIEVSGNYNFTQRETQNDQFKVQTFVLPSDSGQVYSENSLNNSSTASHRLNMRLDYKINESNRVLITPRLSISHNTADADLFGSTLNNSGLLNETNNQTTSENNSYTFNNNIYYSHKFGKAGRTFSTNFTTNYTLADGDNALLANTTYFSDNDAGMYRNQSTDTDKNSYTLAGDATYTEPVGEHGQLQLQYRLGSQVQESDRKTYDVGERDQGLTLNKALSSTYNSTYNTQRIGTGYQYNFEKLRLKVGVDYQIAELQNEQEYPVAGNLTRPFSNVLPTVEMSYKFSNTRNFDFNYTTRTNPPSVEELQDVINNSNPLQLQQGNPELGQNYQHNFRLGLRDFNMETNRVFFAGLFGNVTQDYIGKSITRATNEPIMLSNGEMLAPGQQLIRPVNLDGYWNVRSVLHYGQPVNFLSSNLGIHGSAGFTRTPGLSNNLLTYSNATNLGLGLTLSSNISEKIDFTISTNSTYNIVTSTLQQQNSNYFNQSTSLRYNWTFWKGLVYRTELNHQVNNGLVAGYDNNYLLWNMSLGKKLFKNQQGEISLSVNDLLEQNMSVQRNVLAQYVEDVQSSVLQRYFMLTFTYNLRNFSGSAPTPKGDFQERGPGRFPGGNMPPRGEG
ncbi:TonB-dependent receptor [Pontibacter sp. JH31]|uniref:TonB-dependent receptor n=1 Tax=Pontibacter aquaedesilientis TaxID=2766980 RepID=A0ABR7XJQ2_9BACT|nr:TonB-dependent receptor [Pontibacter aquaedesilientis]MBD1398161.1 TonB-dependent receptor [Pontibacter aquaedesilientis]